MITTSEQIVDFIYSLSDERLEELRENLNSYNGLSAESKEIMNKVIDSVRGTNLKFKIIKKYIDEYDFYSLLKHGAPQDEYDSYSRELAEKISAKDSVKSIAENIANLLDKTFFLNVNPDKYMKIAEKIRNAMIQCEESDSYFE